MRADERATPSSRAHRVVATVWLVASAAFVGSCATSSGSGPADRAVPATVAIGRLPDELTGRPPPPTPPTTAPPSTVPPTVPPDQLLEGPVGEQVLGNRILVIGDGVMASTAVRNDGLMCEALNGFGWDVEVDAEPGRFIEFGHTVLDQRLRPDGGDDWDVAAVMLGNQFDGDVARFTRELDELLRRLAPRPTLLYTVTEVDADRAAINEVIRDRPRYHPNLVVIDWAAISADGADDFLVDGGPNVTEAGSSRLVLFTAGALQQAPGEPPGECLPSVFADDSAIVL